MANSPKVATYDLQPEMSAVELTDRAIAKMQQEQYDFVCLNFANADMVGHTGVTKRLLRQYKRWILAYSDWLKWVRNWVTNS